MIIHVENEKQFDEVIKNGKVIVDFYASWCSPCRALSPILEELDVNVSDVVIAKVNVDDVSIVASRYGIMSIPTLLFFNDGMLVHEQVGLLPLPGLIKLCETHLK